MTSTEFLTHAFKILTEKLNTCMSKSACLFYISRKEEQILTIFVLTEYFDMKKI